MKNSLSDDDVIMRHSKKERKVLLVMTSWWRHLLFTFRMALAWQFQEDPHPPSKAKGKKETPHKCDRYKKKKKKSFSAFDMYSFFECGSEICDPLQISGQTDSVVQKVKQNLSNMSIYMKIKNEKLPFCRTRAIMSFFLSFFLSLSIRKSKYIFASSSSSPFFYSTCHSMSTEITFSSRLGFPIRTISSSLTDLIWSDLILSVRFRGVVYLYEFGIVLEVDKVMVEPTSQHVQYAKPNRNLCTLLDLLKRTESITFLFLLLVSCNG